VLRSALLETDPISMFAAEGRVFYASDADQNDVVTGQTSFAATTPTFLLQNPAQASVASAARVFIIPLMISLTQAGTVAGGDIDVLVEIDNATRYASGGTQETVFCSRTDSPQGATAADGTGSNKGILYSGATAGAGYGIPLYRQHLGPDVSPAEGAVQEVLWTPRGALDFIAPGHSMLVYTYAGTTGPTWLWSFKWLEVTQSDL
jgi:hypothetical protein